MAERPIQPPPEKLIAELLVPDHTNTFFRELVSRESPRFQALNPIKRGTIYSSTQGADVNVAKNYPDLIFLKETVPPGSNTVAGMNQSEWVIWNWMSGEDSESSYNADEISYLGDATGNPVFARAYTVQRNDFEANPTIPTGTPLTALIGVQITGEGFGYTHAEAEFDCSGQDASVEFVINQGRIIEAIVTAEGSGFDLGSVINIIGDGSGATCVTIIQPVEAILTSQKKSEFPDSDPLSHEFVKVLRVYELLPGPWIPFTRYSDSLGPIQGRRRAVLNTGQFGGIVTATGTVNYEGRDGSSVVLLEIQENFSNGTGIPGPDGNPNAPYPLLDSDTYTDERGAVDRTTQIVVKAANEETQEATLTRLNGIVTKTWFEAYADNPFLLTRFVEVWVEVIVNDQAVTSEFGGAILDVTERRDEPGVQVPDTGFLIVSSKLRTTSPHEQTKFTEQFSPASAVPTLDLLDGGSGLASAPAVSFSGGTGTQTAVATAILGFGVASVTVNNSGSNYSFPPMVHFANGNGGGGSAVAVLGFQIASVTVDNGGSGYPTAPAVTATGDGIGSILSSVLGFGLDTPTITNGGSGYQTAPPIKFAAPADGNGRAAIGHTVISGGFVTLIVIDDPGAGYETGETPAIIFIPTGDPGSGAAATSNLLPTGSVKRIVVTSGGTAFTFANIVFSGGGGGSGAQATAVFGLRGKLVRIDVLTAGLYKNNPDVELIGSDGSGGAATAVPASTGSVVELDLTTLGIYTIAPTVVFTPLGPIAIYNIGSAVWPTIHGFHTDEVTGIVVDLLKTVVPDGTPYPGRSGYRGPFIEMQPYDRWKSIQIVSAVDLTTLPPPESWFTTHPFNLPPRLTAIEVFWTDATSKSASANGSRAVASASSGSNGGIIITSQAGFRGYASAIAVRFYLYGEPPLALIPQPFRIFPASGSVVLSSVDSSNSATVFADGGNGTSNGFQSQVHSADVSDHMVGLFTLTSTDKNGSTTQLVQGGQPITIQHLSPPQNAAAVAGYGFAGAIAPTPGSFSTLRVNIPASFPTRFESGQLVLMEVHLEEWRFGIWVIEQIYVVIP